MLPLRLEERGKMDDIDAYLEARREVAASLVRDRRQPCDLMRRDITTFEFPELIRLRKQFLSREDRTHALPYLALGRLGGMSGDELVAALVVVLELEDEASRIDIGERFRKYSDSQPLFTGDPSIKKAIRAKKKNRRPDDELINETAYRTHNGGLVQLRNGWGRIEKLLSPSLVNWAKTEFAGKPLFIRLDPCFWSPTRPPEPLSKAGVRPMRPGWWKSLTLRKGFSEGGHYIRQDPGDPSVNLDHFYEYRLQGIRSLECHAKRENGGRLSMMVEELSELSSHEGRKVVGRCLHLDTLAPQGTPVHKAPVKHLDLAINVFYDEVADQRMAVQMSQGMVDASVRTHLLRIEDIPFTASLEFARHFFRSDLLLAEWIGDLTR